MCKGCTTGQRPFAAVWWRVSTASQLDMSPEVQQTEATKLLESEGYHVPDQYVLGADWSSPEVMDCPEMQELLALVEVGAIHAVGVYHPDRLAAKPAHRLIFRNICEQQNVKLFTANGQLYDGPEGEFLDFAVTWAKYQQVLRAQRSSKEGLRSRATQKGLRPSGRPPFGYEYPNNGSEIDHSRLVASSDWYIVDRFWQKFLNGESIHRIINDFEKEGVLSPKGRPRWDPSTISQMLRNPTYAGRPFGLRYKAVSPLKRTARTYGKSSLADTPMEEWIPLKVSVEPPVVTWEQYLTTQEKLKANQKYSPRNAKYQYLLRGLMACEVHDKNYHGRHHKKEAAEFVYVCSAYRPGTIPGPCKRYIYGNTVDREVWQQAVNLLAQPQSILNALEERKAVQATTERTVVDSLQRLERKLDTNRNAETKLVDLYIKGDISEDVYPRNWALLKDEKAWCEDEIVRLQKQLDAVRQSFVTLEQVYALRERIGQKLATASYDDKRFILEGLETKLLVSPEGNIKGIFSIPTEPTDTELMLTAPERYPLLPERCALPDPAPHRFEPSLATIFLLASGRYRGYIRAGRPIGSEWRSLIVKARPIVSRAQLYGKLKSGAIPIRQ